MTDTNTTFQHGTTSRQAHGKGDAVVSGRSDTQTRVRAHPPAARQRSAAPYPGARTGTPPGPVRSAPVTSRPGQGTRGPIRETRRPPLTAAPSPSHQTLPGAGPAAARGTSRTPFILLIVGLLGGGMVCLLVINTILGAGSYQITALQKTQAAQSQQVQSLRQEVATEAAPATIAKRARQLGMIQPPLTHYLNLTTGKAISQPTRESGVPAVPGYAP